MTLEERINSISKGIRMGINSDHTDDVNRWLNDALFDLNQLEAELKGALVIPEGWELTYLEYCDDLAFTSGFIAELEKDGVSVSGGIFDTRHEALRNALEQIKER